MLLLLLFKLFNTFKCVFIKWTATPSATCYLFIILFFNNFQRKNLCFNFTFLHKLLQFCFFVSYFVFYLERYWTFNLTFNYSHFVKECKTLDTVATFFWNVYLIIKISYFKFIKGRDERPQTTLAHSQQQRSFVCALLLLLYVSFPRVQKPKCRFADLSNYARFSFVLFRFRCLFCDWDWDWNWDRNRNRDLKKSKKSKNINAFILLFYFGLGSFYGFLLCMPLLQSRASPALSAWNFLLLI